MKIYVAAEAANSDDADETTTSMTITTLPVYPGGQRQVYVRTSSTHVAPLRHL